MTDIEKAIECMQHIEPSALDYSEWLSVGMALKSLGADVDVWDVWSGRDERHKAGDCQRKWEGFNGDGITIGTIIHLASDQGYYLEGGGNEIPKDQGQASSLEWDAEIGGKDEVKDEAVKVIDFEWLQGEQIPEPTSWSPVHDIKTYLEVLFNSDEHVGYVTGAWYNEEAKKYLPKRGNWDRTAGQLLEELNKKKNINDVFGDSVEECGAWIRFNPLDGEGIRDDNVTDYRYGLVESDEVEIDKQYAIIKELELPVAMLVHSGGKSLHAIVRIDANDYGQYKERIDFLYKVCKDNGLIVDRQNRNPSRLSRMPGITRQGKKQFIVDKNIGQSSWDDWREWVEDINDELPDFEAVIDRMENLPPLAQPLIDGVLRQGHKMMLAAPSKAGKSFGLIELGIAIAEGSKWIGWQCTKGKVLYINLELDWASCFHRFNDCYKGLGINPDNVANLDVWNLRGHSVPMDRLAPKLIRRALKKKYIAIIIDPIYKVITGDENSAAEMAHFCNQFDKICHQLGCAVIFCHHHSKGSQGAKKSQDRSSGSGVFARDPDAIIDMIKLDIDEDRRRVMENNAVCKYVAEWLDFNCSGWENDVNQDEQIVEKHIISAASRLLGVDGYAKMLPGLVKVREAIHYKTAWRMEGDLREFADFKPFNIFFEYPIHRIDTDGMLTGARTEGEQAPWESNKSKKKGEKVDRKQQRKNDFISAITNAAIDGNPTIQEVSDYLGLTDKTIWNRVKEFDFIVENGRVIER